jgi:NTP pyrophosphatase (non-canonical NTP hydrolase)
VSGITLRNLQKYIRDKDHHPEMKLQYLQKLVEEMGELAKAMRKDIRYSHTQDIQGTLEEELYDVLYYVVALSNTYDVDLETVMRLKEPISSAKYGQMDKLEQIQDKSS